MALVVKHIADPTDVMDGVTVLGNFGIETEDLCAIPVEKKLNDQNIYVAIRSGPVSQEPQMRLYNDYTVKNETYGFSIIADRHYIVCGEDTDYVSPELIVMHMPRIRMDIGKKIVEDIRNKTLERVFVTDVTTIDSKQKGFRRMWKLKIAFAFVFTN